MSYFKVHIIYPNAEEEIIEEDFYTLSKAKEYADHILGEVQYNAAFHAKKIDFEGDVVSVEPYCQIVEISNDGQKVVFDTRNKQVS